MIVHAASMVAFFKDQFAQAPVQIQRVSNIGQDPLWARLLFAAIPSVFALGIAWMAVRWNGTKENKQWERNRQAAHEQWIRDQKKAEWDQLLSSVDACQIYGLGHYVEMKHSGDGLLLPAALQIDQANRVDQLMSCPVFIDTKAAELLRHQLNELKKKRIIGEYDMEDLYGSDPKWKGKEAEYRNILWIPSEERDRLVQSINEAARKDLLEFS